MIAAGTGLSTGLDSIKCAREAARSAMERLGGSRADTGIVFCTGAGSESYEPILRTVREICGTDSLTGCSGAGVLTESGEVEGETGVAVLAVTSDSLLATPFSFSGLKGRDDEIGRSIGRLVRHAGSEQAIVVLFPDTLSCNPERLFNGIRREAGPVPVVGGGAGSSDPNTRSTFQFCGGEVESNAVSGLLISGGFASSVGITQCCLPIGGPRRITGSLGNAIRSLDGAPALEALMESLSGPCGRMAKDLHKLASHVFMAFPGGVGSMGRRGQYVVRSILGVDPDDGSIYVGHEVSEGDVVCFALRDPDGAREDLKQMLAECRPVDTGPSLGLYFNCAARGRGLYGIPDIDTSYIANTFARVPVVGFFGFAEIAPLHGLTRLHNYSGVMVLVSESTAAQRPS